MFTWERSVGFTNACEEPAMNANTYDVLILGGGNAALGATVATRAAGLSVAVVEARDLGGTCPNRGCTPKKVLVAAAHALHEIERAKVHCIRVAEPTLDWAALIDREKAIIRPIPDRLAQDLADRGIDLIRGRARFVGPNRVRVGDRTLEAKQIVIATGSKPRTLPIPGAEHMITSDEVLSERQFPQEVVFVGGGVIALEFSHVYARAGAKVTILEVLPRLLPQVEADAVDHIAAESQRIGIGVYTEVKVKRIEPSEGRFRVVFEHAGIEHALRADRVVNGAGRIPDVDTLDLAAGNVAHDGTRIMVDEFQRSVSNPAVYVCGDALWSAPQLSPLATYEGRLVGRNIVEGPRHRPDFSAVPSCVFTIPAVASVGLTEAAAREKGLRVKAYSHDMLEWISARTFAETVAWAKVLVDEASDRIVGAHIVGHSGEELIHLFTFAMRHGITASQIRETVYAFPTFSADIPSMM
jgi:glutathione reductase (NADPH)